MSRVDAVRIAIEKAQDAQPELLAGSALASDAFFPFADGPELAMGAGRHRDHPARRLGARRGRRRRRGRGGGGDGRHRAPALPALRPGPAPAGLRNGRPERRPAPSDQARRYDRRMCRNIRNLYNFEPPATEDEVHASSLQYVRKISGFTKPSQANAGRVRARRRGGRRDLATAAGRTRDERAAEGPRGRGREGPRPRRPALRGLAAGNAARRVDRSRPPRRGA